MCGTEALAAPEVFRHFSPCADYIIDKQAQSDTLVQELAMLREFCSVRYGMVKIGTEGGAMVEVVADRHMTKGPKDIVLDGGKKVTVTVDEHDGYHAKGSVNGTNFFDLIKTARIGFVINGLHVIVLHENRV